VAPTFCPGCWLAKASALMMLGDKVTAEEAERMVMIYKYFSNDTFEEERVR
jgi:2-(1,2-epoxy-1,2-dihydrophenyl)acetyl-CoA isomerase